MATIGEHIRWLMPAGSTQERPGEWDACPEWPPDLYAVAASLIEASECYTAPRYSVPGGPDAFFTARYARGIDSTVSAWTRAEGRTPPPVRRDWELLGRHRDRDLRAPGRETGAWQDAAVRLLSVADQASRGIGFVSSRHFAAAYLKDYVLHKQGGPRALQLPHSVCRLVPPDRACVQPKTNTPQTGCTLRSMSHHLALLPPMGMVRTRWDLSLPAEREEERDRLSRRPIGILLVPFPYRVGERCFVAHEARPPAAPGAPRFGFFDLEQRWFDSARGQRLGPERAAAELGGFLLALVEEASEEHGDVHGLVLPEAALFPALADDLATMLARGSRLEWLVAGVAGPSGERPGVHENRAQLYRFHEGRVIYTFVQKKHHRWRLDRSQIQQYGLGRALDAGAFWWERIALDPRECNFYVVRRGASMAAIVCEDLARHDPVMPVLRAVGPNLVVALLMDGPQLKERWPARHATVLADDPGCSVLTLTSLGMVRRSSAPIHGSRREIALWKQPDGPIEELKLPEGDHALLLTLRVAGTTQVTLDTRSDEGMAPRLERADTRGIRLRHGSIPDWLQID